MKSRILGQLQHSGAINGIIELGTGTARRYHNPTNYQLRILLITAGLDTCPHTEL